MNFSIDRYFFSFVQLLKGLAERLSTLTDESSFTDHMCGLYDRLMDDHEQISRKVNLRLNGVRVPAEMSEEEDLLEFIRSEVKRCNVRVDEDEYESAEVLGSMSGEDEEEEEEEEEGKVEVAEGGEEYEDEEGCQGNFVGNNLVDFVARVVLSFAIHHHC